MTPELSAINKRRIKYDTPFRVDDHNFFIYSQVAGSIQYSIDGLTWEEFSTLNAGLTPVKNCPVHAVYKVTTTATYNEQSPTDNVTRIIPPLSDWNDGVYSGDAFTFVAPVPGHTAQPVPDFMNKIVDPVTKGKWIDLWNKYQTYTDELLLCN